MSKSIVIDLDHTICNTESGDYKNSIPNQEVIDCLVSYKKIGFNIIIFTSRNMKTYNGNLGKINAVTLPLIIGWLEKHNVPYDEIYVGKPWCGDGGFYVDDRAVRPAEFVKHTFSELTELIDRDKCFL